MDAGVAQRVQIAGVVGVLGLVCVAALSAAARPAGAEPPAAALLPDLTVPKPGEIFVVRRGERRILRFSHGTANQGDGPLEISPDLNTTSCSEGGEDGREAHQYVFRDQDGSGTFERNLDGPPEGRPVGCMIFHKPHNHYHFKDFALYQLYRERTGKLVGTSDKVSFCVFDLMQVGSGLPGTPAYYGFTNCDEEDGTHGISVGWADLYGAQTQGQALDVTGMARGRYCLMSIADPEDRLDEKPGAEGNNIRRLRIGLRPRRGAVKPVDAPCRTAVPSTP